MGRSKKEHMGREEKLRGMTTAELVKEFLEIVGKIEALIPRDDAPTLRESTGLLVAD